MRSDPSRLESIYTKHPLRAETILARLGLLGAQAGRVSEADLATDPQTCVTDQNHPGGAAGVRELARETGVGSGCRILDVGCGLGGSARVLAEEYGAYVDGVELTATRHRDAILLTRLAGLDERVRILHGDFLTLTLPSRHYDVAWGQSAWAHFSDLRAVFARCAEVLRPGGRVAVEEAYLRGRLRTPAAISCAQELEECCAIHLCDRDEWEAAAAGQGFRLASLADITMVFGRDVSSQQQAACRQQIEVIPDEEVRSRELACKLIQDGTLGYLRLVATLPDPAS